MIQELQISQLNVDQSTQCRQGLDEPTVDAYAADLEAGDTFPLIQVLYDGVQYWLVDGFHRVAAAARAGHSSIKAAVSDGTQQDAAWEACAANKRHGLRRTNQDKRRAVETALRLRPEESDRLIAEHVGVSHPTVSRVRDTMTGKIYQSPDTAHVTQEPPAAPRLSTVDSGDLTRTPPRVQCATGTEKTEGRAAPDTATASALRVRKCRDGRTIDTAKIGKTTTPTPTAAALPQVKETEPEGSPLRLSAYAIGTLQRIDLADERGVQEMQRVRSWIDRALAGVGRNESVA